MNTDDQHQDRRQRDIDRRSRWVGRALIAGGLVALIVLLVCLTGPAATAAVVGAGAAVATAFIAWKSLTQLVDDSNKRTSDSYQRTRPYVSLRVVPGVWGAEAADLIVSNDGESMAYDVLIDFGDMTREDGPKDDDLLARISEYLAHQEFYMPPHVFERFMWRYAKEPGQSGAPVYGMPIKVTATVSYNSARTQGNSDREFNEKYILSAGMLDAVPVPWRGHRTNETPPLANIDEAIRALAVHVAQMRSR